MCVTCYFEKRRAFATGLAVCGSGIGSAIFAPLTDILIAKLNWKGAMLVISFLVLCCAFFGCLFKPLPGDEEDEYEDEDDNDTCESHHLNDSLNDLPSKGQLPRFSLDNANVNGIVINITNGKLAPATKTTSGGVNSYLKPKTICYSASVLSLPHYKSSPALFAVDSIVVRSNSTAGCRTGSTKILNCKGSNDAYNNNDLDDSKSDSNDMVIEKSSKNSHTNSYLAATLKIFTDFEILKNGIFLLFTISNLATSLGFYVPHIYLKDKVVLSNGSIENDDPMSPNRITGSDAAQLYGLIGLGSTVGRLVFGYLSDQPFINRLWLYIICVTVSGAGVLISAFTDSYSILAACSITFGLAGGGYVSLTSVLLVDLLGLEKLMSAVSLEEVFLLN